MTSTFLDIHIAIPPDEYIREVLPGVIADLGFDGFVEDDRGIHCYIKKELWLETMEQVIKELTEQLHLPMFEILSITEIQNQNWNEQWEKSIQPIHVTDHIIIAPSWHPVHEPSKLVLTIDPKMTFGTGYHETTRLMLRLMEQFITHNGKVLDVGTGTGILAITAIKLGAAKAIGIDIDEWSLDNGIENIKRNNVEKHVDIRIGSIDTVTENNFDIILANIVRNTILELLDGMIAKLSSQGILLLSGLLATDRAVIEKALHSRNFKVVSAVQENEWIALATRRV
ncbi:MAG: 50S ribosomal protein L11 methyltransferase [Bacteroidota bacterium]|nr:50S ribosomal protein L11 methyltransferase [Bacteroidota bacterium]